MNRVLLALCALGVVCSAATVRIEQIGPTVAHAYISGFTGSCKWNLYEGTSASGIPHPDVTAVTDTSRSDTFLRGNTRVMRLGHDYGDFPLAVNTDYTLATDGSDTGCSGTSAVTFRTYFQPPPISTQAFIPKWNANSYYGVWGPTHDFTTDCTGQFGCLSGGRRKLYTAPFTGVRYELFGQAMVDKEDTDSSGSRFAFDNYVTKGTGWTNPGNAGNGALATYATTTTTNPIVLIPFMNGVDYWGTSPLAAATNGLSGRSWLRVGMTSVW
jgi:hypothetical protein